MVKSLINEKIWMKSEITKLKPSNCPVLLFPPPLVELVHPGSCPLGDGEGWVEGTEAGLFVQREACQP